jgi:uncharacterized membrane protein
VSQATSTGLDARLASTLCYAGWWITGVVFLLVERDHPGVRFHAAQAVVVFGAATCALVGLGAASAVALLTSGPAFRLLRAGSDVVWLAAVLLWVVLLVRSWRGETWRVPLAAGLAARIAR